MAEGVVLLGQVELATVAIGVGGLVGRLELAHQQHVCDDHDDQRRDDVDEDALDIKGEVVRIEGIPTHKENLGEDKPDHKEQHRGDGELGLGAGELANHATGLAVHGKQVTLAVPRGGEHPHGEQGIVAVFPGVVELLAFDRGVVKLVDDGLAQGRDRALLHAALGARLAGLAVLVVAVGDVAGHIGNRERAQRIVVKRLDGVHMAVGHLGRSVDGHALKRDIALAVGIVVVGGRDGAVGFLGYGLVGRIKAHLAVHAGAVKPKRHVNALDFVDMVAGDKALGQ